MMKFKHIYTDKEITEEEYEELDRDVAQLFEPIIFIGGIKTTSFTVNIPTSIQSDNMPRSEGFYIPPITQGPSRRTGSRRPAAQQVQVASDDHTRAEETSPDNRRRQTLDLWV